MEGVATVDTLGLHARQKLLAFVVEGVEEDAEDVAFHAVISCQQLDVVDEPALTGFVVFLGQIFGVKFL